MKKKPLWAFSIVLVLMQGQVAWAENFRVSNGLLRAASDILGTPVTATQRMFRENAIRVLQQGGTRFVRFTIQHGDIGGAPTDNDPEHSRLFNRPWSERVELRTRDTMRRNSLYEIRFRARIVEGYTGPNGTFFQLHTGTKPALMFFFRSFSQTEWTAALMQGCSQSCTRNDDPEMESYQRRATHRESMRRWIEYRIVLDTGSTPEMSVWIDGRPLIQDEAFVIPLGQEVYSRIGSYRSGNLGGQPTSVIDYSMLEVTRLGSAPD